MAVSRVGAKLYAATRQAPGGMVQQAIAAVENALLDIKGRALGVRVCDLLGGAVRDRLELYWSHCGTYRFGAPSRHIDRPPIETLDELAGLAGEIRDRGFRALKTNIFLFGDDGPRLYMPGFTASPGWPELNASPRVVDALRRQLGALREGAGPDVGIHLDLNFNFKTEGYLQITRALDDLGLTWFEIDLYDPAGLARIRDSVRTPIASCESLFGIRGFRPYFEHAAMDVAIVDVPWNGAWEGLKIAAMADAHEVNVAPHNFYGHLSDPDERSFLRRDPELPRDGDRHRRRAVEGRSGDRGAGDRGRLSRAPAGTGVGDRAERGRDPRPPTAAGALTCGGIGDRLLRQVRIDAET